MDWSQMGAVFNIVMIDLVLSGDNALVIAMAVRSLPERQRRFASVLGAGGAIGLRVIFTALAALLLTVALLQAIGGVILAWIALRLLTQDDHGHEVKASASMKSAIWTIIAADVVMSLDNMLAVGAAAHGDIPLLLFGLVLSMSIMLTGSQFVASLMQKFPWLVPVGAAILALTAGRMIGEDAFLREHLPGLAEFAVFLPILSVVAVMIVALARSRAARPLTHYGIALGCAVVLAVGSSVVHLPH